MILSPSQRLKRLRDIHLAAAEQRKSEAARPRDLADGLARRVEYLRLRELRDWLMTGAEIRENRRLEREAEQDRRDERDGDWTR